MRPAIFLRPLSEEFVMSFVSVAGRAFAAAVLVSVAFTATPGMAVEPLVTPQWLNEHLKDPQVVVLDVRSAVDGGGAEAYAKAHIRGAVHSDYDKAGWRVSRNGVLQLPSKAELEKLIGETGIDEDVHVVDVPAGVSATDFGSAARVYWTLKVAGHPAVSILDGGFAAWQAAGYATDSVKVIPTPRIFTLKFDEGLLAKLTEVEQNEHATLVDARPANFFDGKQKAPASKAYGHIPGAINIDSASFYDPATNRLRPKDQLAAIAAKLPSGPVVAYCNTGHWAATDWFVLSAVLGRPDVRLYPGSMVEWTANPSHPVASSRTRLDDLKKALGLGT
jgi:thiosulfate/3-mercaptopyruvate sulfurtransferase